MGTKKYPVITNGEILPDYESETVISELAELLSVPNEIVSTILLDGSPRKLKTFSSRLAAKKLISKLRAVGLKCSVSKLDENSIQLNKLSNTAEQQDISNGAKVISSWIVVIILFVLGVCAVLYFL